MVPTLFFYITEHVRCSLRSRAGAQHNKRAHLAHSKAKRSPPEHNALKANSLSLELIQRVKQTSANIFGSLSTHKRV